LVQHSVHFLSSAQFAFGTTFGSNFTIWPVWYNIRCVFCGPFFALVQCSCHFLQSRDDRCGTTFGHFLHFGITNWYNIRVRFHCLGTTFGAFLMVRKIVWTTFGAFFAFRVLAGWYNVRCIFSTLVYVWYNIRVIFCDFGKDIENHEKQKEKREKRKTRCILMKYR
jgi:uncharacterized membrane protein YhdT